MSYIDDAEGELRDLLFTRVDDTDADDQEWAEGCVVLFGKKLRESFINGIQAERHRSKKGKSSSAQKKSSKDAK